MSLRPFLALALSLAALLGLAACGGSISLGFGHYDDDAPSVSLAVSPTSAARGDTLRLVAAASDDYAVVAVEFYRVDPGGTTLLGSDLAAPYQLDTVVPAGAGANLQYVARAVDDAGQRTDSAAATIIVTP